MVRQARQLDGAALDDPSREPKPVPGASRCSIAPIERATKLPTRARSGHAHTLWHVIFSVAPDQPSDPYGPTLRVGAALGGGDARGQWSRLVHSWRAAYARQGRHRCCRTVTERGSSG
jgi:hypothetical protein